MKPLYSEKDWKNAKPKDLLPLQCYHCKKTFYKSKHYIQDVLNPNHKTTGKFCSHKCSTDNVNLGNKKCVCGNCKKPFKRSVSDLRNNKSKNKSENVFCSQSCAATYNNRHKKYGIRRSKLEVHLEKYLKQKYPNLEVICNGKDAIGSELDFYFPDLKFAVELNGIFHYEPIYGEDKLERIQDNDRQKVARCREVGIELVTIDISWIKYLTKPKKEKVEKIIDVLLGKVMGRSGAG